MIGVIVLMPLVIMLMGFIVFGLADINKTLKEIARQLAERPSEPKEQP